jgi:hypothetical protein
VQGATPDAIVQALSTAPATRVLEIERSLGDEARTRLEAKLRELHERSGARAYVVLVLREVDVEHYPIAPLYQRLGLAHRDVLILASPAGRHLRTLGLPKEAGTEILQATREAYHRSQLDGLVAVIDELERRFSAAAPSTSAVATPPPPGKSAGLPLPVVVLVALVVALAIGTLLRRRKPGARIEPRGDERQG